MSKLLELGVVATQSELVEGTLRCLDDCALRVPDTQVLLFEPFYEVIVDDLPVCDVLLFRTQNLDDDAIDRIAELRRKSHAKIVVVSDGDATNTVVKALRAGASDYLEFTDTFGEEFKSVLLHVGGTIESSTGTVISLLSTGGGAGASLIATNLAAALASQQGECLLLDLHRRGGTLAELLKLKPRHTTDSLMRKSELDESMLRQSVVEHDCGIHLLAAPDCFEEPSELTSDFVQRLLAVASSSYRTIVIDADSIDHEWQQTALACSEHVMPVTCLNVVSLMRTVEYLKFLREHISPQSIRLIVNKVGLSFELERKHLRKRIDPEIATSFVPHDPGAVNKSVNVGVPAIVECPKAALPKAINELANTISPIEEPVAPTRSAASFAKAAALLVSAISVR